jgi:hypothetical protein
MGGPSSPFGLRRGGLRYERLAEPKRRSREGWWCAQSDTNRSPCYLANIRVFFENNSDPAAETAKKTCGTGIY